MKAFVKCGSTVYTVTCILNSPMQRVEVCVSNVEVYVHDAVDRNIDFLSVLEVKGHVSILAEPMPDK